MQETHNYIHDFITKSILQPYYLFTSPLYMKVIA